MSTDTISVLAIVVPVLISFLVAVIRAVIILGGIRAEIQVLTVKIESHSAILQDVVMGLRTHGDECDNDRAVFREKLDRHEERLRAHSERIDELRAG